jgi:hypothetical protein
MSDDFEREERAFAEALRGALEGEEFRPLDPRRLAAPAPGPRVGRPWLKGLAAAASVVLVVGAAGTVLPRMFSVSGSGSSRSGAAPAAGASAPGTAEDRGSAETSAASSKPSRWVATAAPPLSPRTQASVGWLEGRYYVVGGADCAAGVDCPSSSQLRSGASYNPGIDAWIRIADAPVPLAGVTPVAVGEALYYLTADGDFVSYRPAEDTWTTLPPGAAGGLLVGAQDRVIEVARVRTSAGTPLDRVFDPGTGTWTVLPADPLPASDGRVAVVAGNRLVLSAQPASATDGAGAVAELDLDTLAWRTLSLRVSGRHLAAVGDTVVWPAPGSATPVYAVSSEEFRRITPPKKGVDRGFDGIVAGGRVAVGLWLLDPASGQWTALPSPGADLPRGATLGGGEQGILLFGGSAAGSAAARFLPIG